jgi:hypothetical protein
MHDGQSAWPDNSEAPGGAGVATMGRRRNQCLVRGMLDEFEEACLGG